MVRILGGLVSTTRAQWRAAEERAVITASHLARPASTGPARLARASRVLVGDMVRFSDDRYHRVIAAWHAQGLTHLVSSDSSVMVYDTDMLSVRS